MKIISKFKDFYDYFVTEVDNTRVWNRHTERTLNLDKELNFKWPRTSWNTSDNYSTWDSIRRSLNLSDYIVQTAFICNRAYWCIMKGNTIYNNMEAVKSDPVLYKLLDLDSKYKWNRINESTMFESFDLNINTVANCPVILNEGSRWTKNPNLSETFIKSVITPKDMYLIVYDFLAPKEVEINRDPKDKSRFESKGFDSKTSFRNIK